MVCGVCGFEWFAYERSLAHSVRLTDDTTDTAVGSGAEWRAEGGAHRCGARCSPLPAHVVSASASERFFLRFVRLRFAADYLQRFLLPFDRTDCCRSAAARAAADSRVPERFWVFCFAFAVSMRFALRLVARMSPRDLASDRLLLFCVCFLLLLLLSIFCVSLLFCVLFGLLRSDLLTERVSVSFRFGFGFGCCASASARATASA